jgi:hypothetical protein
MTVTIQSFSQNVSFFGHGRPKIFRKSTYLLLLTAGRERVVLGDGVELLEREVQLEESRPDLD